ncbi:MAG: nucleotide sugar dehydrogenase [Verrucomicrobia bacterium]|nr:nucleotide sugar dehydrogenase [Verrucomicrobiota bacterium]
MSAPGISVFGLGYVGSVTAAALAERGCLVTGCDVSASKVDLINRGAAPIGEPGLDELLRAQWEAGRVRATVDAGEAVGASEVSIVCVGTPSAPSGALDLQFVEAVSAQLAAAIRRKGRPHAVVFRSTMLPGSTRRIAEASFGGMESPPSVYFFPEFLRQGSALADFRNPSLAALGVLEPGQSVEPVSMIVDPGIEIMPVESAELLKYACNAFHAMKVVFANEIGRLGKDLGIDSTAVMSTLCRDTRLNLSPYYLKPGTPFGGSCLPKDVAALTHQARKLGVSLPMLDSLMESNRRHLESLLERIERTGIRSVVLVGLAFKDGTDDLRGSAMLELAAQLLLRGYEVRIFDPAVSAENLIGANRVFANAKLPRFEELMVSHPGDAVGEDSDHVLVVSKACLPVGELRSCLRGRGRRHLIDVNGWRELAELGVPYEGLCW